MKKLATLLLLLATAVIAACQSPDGEPVEVTREVTRLVTVAAEPVGTPEPETVVVTQVVVEREEVPVEVEVTPQQVGTADRPIILWSAPSSGADLGQTRADIVSETLADLTGYTFEVRLPETDGEAAEALCQNPMVAMAILPPEAVLAAERRCDAEMALTAVRFEQPWQAGMIVVRADSGINSLEDLAGASWGVAALDSLPNGRAIQALLAEAGVEVGEVVEVGSDTEAMLAVFNGDVDFATAPYIPPILPNFERVWQYGEDDPEMWRQLTGFVPERSPVGYVLLAGEPRFGGWRIRDARALAFDVAPQIFNETRILQLSPPIPNDTLTFGPGFSYGVARDIVAALETFAADEACQQSICSRDFYNWETLMPVGDAEFEPVRAISRALDG